MILMQACWTQLIQTRASSPSSKRTKCLLIGANQSNFQTRSPSLMEQAPLDGVILSPSSSPFAWNPRVTRKCTRAAPYALMLRWTQHERVAACILANSRSQPLFISCQWPNSQELRRMKASWRNISRRRTKMHQRRFNHMWATTAKSRLVSVVRSKLVMWVASGEDIPRSYPKWCL
jgi:hypothetical protein